MFPITLPFTCHHHSCLVIIIIPPVIHPMSSCLWGWWWVVCYLLLSLGHSVMLGFTIWLCCLDTKGRKTHQDCGARDGGIPCVIVPACSVLVPFIGWGLVTVVGACGSGGSWLGGTPSSLSIVKSLPKIFVVSHKEMKWEKKDKTHLWPKRHWCLLGPLFFLLPHRHPLFHCCPCHCHLSLSLLSCLIAPCFHPMSSCPQWQWWLVICCSPFRHSHCPSLSPLSLLHYNTSTLQAGACSSGFSWSHHPRHGCAILVLSHCYSVKEVEVVLGWLVVVVWIQTMCDVDDAELKYPFSGNAKGDLEENSKVSWGVLKALRPFKLPMVVICLHVAYIV